MVDKPGGWTSHQVVGRARRLLGTRKVGHAGTLDPMATGVLVLGVGRATRLLGHLSLTDKEYLATIRLGQSTVTDDAEGAVTAADGASGVTDAAVDQAMVGLRGEIAQVPSSVSAIKVNGVRSYARVRSGDEVNLRPGRSPCPDSRYWRRRDLVVEQVPVIELDVVVECSSGTYVRALARDLGTGLGTGGHLTALRRTRVGPFTLDEAQPLDGERREGEGLVVTDITTVATRCFPSLTLDAEAAAAVRVGRRLAGTALPGAPTALLDPDGTFLALYRPDGEDAVAEAVFVG